MSNDAFVNVTDFTPNDGQWSSLGNWSTFTRSGNAFTLGMSPGPVISFLSATVVRVRFNAAANYTQDNSYAVVNPNLGTVSLTVNDGPVALEIDTGVIRVLINKAPYALSIYRGTQLIHGDIDNTNNTPLPPYYNLVYLPAQGWVANLKSYPAGALYFGFGEKAGATLNKNQCTMTFFNFDNFTYQEGPLPSNVSLDTPFPVGQGGPLNPAEPLYCSVPLLIETNPNPAPAGSARYSYGLFFDNPGQTYFNIGVDGSHGMFGKYYFGALYGDLNYYFLYGDEVPQVVQQYMQLTGFPPLPPKYVFGYHQGCYGYYTEDILVEAASAYRAAQIPIDGLHIDVDFQDNYRTFTSSNEKFPNPLELFGYLHSRGFKCSTNITPLVTNNPIDETNNPAAYTTLTSGQALSPPAFLQYSPSSSPPDFVGTVDYGSNGPDPANDPVNPFISYGNPLQAQNMLGAQGLYPDFGRPDVQAWWGSQYAYLLSLGLDMVWQDMTCPAIVGTDNTFPLDLLVTSFGTQVQNAQVHNAYALTLLQATFEGLAQLRPATRNFIIARGGYAGIQRYAALWTGDSASSWEFLKVNLPMVLNLGLSGIPISGCDIGGFAPGLVGDGTTSTATVQDGKVVGGITNYELLTRWILLGSFLPWFRNHYDGYAKQFQEPYAYGEPVPTNCRYFIGLRYRMLPLYYSLMYEATQTGMPIARALFLNDPGDSGVYTNLDDQFFVGDDFLVAPLVDQYETASPPVLAQRNVYLPGSSNWYAFMDNNYPLAPYVTGPANVPWNAPLSNPPQFLTPMYVRAGAILPMQEAEQWVGQLSPNPLTFNVYPGPARSFNLYLDDGVSTPSGNCRLTTISQTGTSTSQQVTVLRVIDNYTPPEAFYYVSFLGQPNPPSSVTAAGSALTNLGDPAVLAASPVNAYYHNATINQTFIKIYDSSSDVTIVATYPG